MFVVQNYIKTRKAKIQAWEEAREKWVRDTSAADYHYRSRRDYESSHPMPVADFETIAKLTGICLAILTVICFVGSVIYEHVNKHDVSQKQTAMVKSDECGRFKKGDHVVVQYGDFATAQGTLIGGCGNQEDYQVKLDTKQYLSIPNDGVQGSADVGGKIISVNSDSNLVVVH